MKYAPILSLFIVICMPVISAFCAGRLGGRLRHGLRRFSESLSSDGFRTVKEMTIGNAKCVLVECPPLEAFDMRRLPSTEQSEVFTAELDQGMLAAAAASKRFVVHVGGRIAMRRAWRSICVNGRDAQGHILRSAHGAPLLTNGYRGSISHKDSFAVGAVLCTDNGDVVSIGIDLEKVTNRSHGRLQARLLTEEEQRSVGHSNSLGEEMDVMLRFSFKEAVYKALHPWVGRYIGFQEAAVYPDDQGGAEVQLLWEGAEQFTCSGVWQSLPPYVLTMIQVRRNPS